MIFLLLLVCLGCFTSGSFFMEKNFQYADNQNFSSFRKNKLKLPIRERSFNLLVVDAVHAGLINNSCEQSTPNCILLPGTLLLSERNGFPQKAADSIKRSGMSVLPYNNDSVEADKKYIVFPQGSLQEYRQVKSLVSDLDSDGVEENYSLQDGRVTVTTDERVIWQTPEAWWVDDFFLSDSNNDGNSDLSLLVWKSGSFGPQKPFWITSEDKSIKNHLFVFKLKNGIFKPEWQSSNLDRPLLAADITDLDDDGKQELVAVEGSYRDPSVQQVTIWRWKGWGFYMVSE